MSASRDPGRASSPRRRRPALLIAVFGVFLLLIGLTASGLVAVSSAHLESTTLNQTVSRDASLVELFVNSMLRTDDVADLDPGALRLAEVNHRLAALTRSDGILRIDVRDPDGGLRFSSEGVAGQVAPSAALQRALAGVPSARLEAEGRPADLVGADLHAAMVISEYLPVQTDGSRTMAAVVLWRDAGPLLAAIGQAERDIVLLVVGAGAVLAIVLLLLFRAAQARIFRQQEQLLEASRRDALTGLLNHGTVVGMLAELVEGSHASGEPIAVALLDIDNFRLFNETHGHDAGDEVLLHVAELVRSVDSDASVAGRYGPDEFLLAWRGAGPTDTERRIASLRGAVAELEVRFAGSERLPVTVSAGIAGVPAHANSIVGLLSEAAVALAEARASGGDAVRIARAAAEVHVDHGFDVLQGLVIAVDTKDRYTKRHSEDVSRYAVFLARRIGLDEEAIATIRISGLLHDVGKIGIPDTLLRKPSKLTAEEFDIFKQHVALGDAIVRDLPNVEAVREGIRHHHERWDGRGYLEGLEGEAIPLVGRIMAVADAFSAMTTTRPYRRALSVQEALKRLGDAADTQLEERLVTAFIHGIETAPDAPMPGDDAARIWRPERRVA